MTKTIKILLADDHKLFLEGLAELIKKRPDIELSGQAKNGLQAIEEAEKIKPDIILMDIAMPELNGIKALKRILAKFPDMKFIMLSMYNSRELIVESLRAGAQGYILKECTSDELYEAIKSVINGNFYIARSSLAVMVEDYLRLLKADERNSAKLLSEREREVLKLLAGGKNAKEIAYDLSISKNTVDVHRRHIMEKTGCNTIASLVRYAIREGY
ncbi:MAG: response regulator transcription factor [Synergistaceae bacterium]|nr:response regulator transcription factor [Synergistaceae bacterium]MBQ6737572.1 response regulator transcription factor [Synergistaceae bacterium]MBR0253741.1 response regulator transcription factor [Synergistaceae bacterium]MBR0315363.1 response regulator transcription factor [Synergistaceae bacterium]